MGENNKKSWLRILLLCLLLIFCNNSLSANMISTIKDSRLQNSNFDLKKFGAVGDGVADDSNALIKALAYAENEKYTVLELDGNFVYNLYNKKISLPKRLSLKFSGSIIKDAELIGDYTLIMADPVKIFDNVKLSGSFINTNTVFVEWFGTFPNDVASLDLKKSLELLNKVFFSVSLNQGIYFTKSGAIPLKGIKGIGAGQTFIEFQSNADNLHLFHVGKIKGKVSERIYENNYLKSVTLVLTAGKKIYNNTLVLIGACHQVKIDDVKFVANSLNTSLNKAELLQISSSNIQLEFANVSIRFDGASELLDLNNIFTLSDIGIKFTSNTDFVNISNYTAWNGQNGFSTIYFEDTTISNVLFSGNQSWSQGLYGVYAKNATGYNNFVNVKFENIRIEQLNTEVKDRDNVLASSFFFGNYIHIPNLILSNIMLAGTANGIRFGTIKDGRISLDNISVFYDKSVRRKFALEFTFEDDGSAELSMDNVQLPSDLPVNIVNSNYTAAERKTNFNNMLIKRK